MPTPTPTPTPTAAAKPKSAAKPVPAAETQTIPDPAVQNTDNGTVQTELRPEEYPDALLTTPPSEQRSPTGRLSDGILSKDPAIREGMEEHEALRAKAQAAVDKANEKAAEDLDVTVRPDKG